MIVVSNRPCNGVDMSHWNADITVQKPPTWLKFFGHKATHPGGNGMIEGVDPRFAVRRAWARQFDSQNLVPWRAFYMWVLPTTQVRAAEQVALLVKAVGTLSQGEAVYLDWEDQTVTFAMIEEISFYMNLEFPNRWFMYVNDMTPDMVSWMESNRDTDLIPLMHPAYNLDKGLMEARKWNATIWQTGEGSPPDFKGVVPLDYVLRPDMLDWVCGRS